MRACALVVAVVACGGSAPPQAAAVLPQVVTIKIEMPSAGGVVLPGGRACEGGQQCVVQVPRGAAVTLQARGALLLRFDRWEGGVCTPATRAICSFAAEADATVRPVFSRLAEVSLAFDNFGRGALVQGGQAYRNNGYVLLAPDDGCVHAVAEPGSTFAGWIDPAPGAVNAAGDYCFTADFPLEITANFTLDEITGQFPVQADVRGAGQGRVVSQPDGIDVARTADGAYVVARRRQTLFEPGVPVTLTAIPAAGSRFAGWIGDCHGTGPCIVTETTRTVAVFAVEPIASFYTLVDLGDIGYDGVVNGIASDGTVFGAVASIPGKGAFIARDSIQILPLDARYNSEAKAMNGAGVVVGYFGFKQSSRNVAGSPATAFRFKAGTVEKIAAADSYAYGIDDAGTIVGDFGAVPFLWNGAPESLPGWNGCTASAARAISSTAIVAGSIRCPASSESHAALFAPGGVVNLGTTTGAHTATAVNASGQALLDRSVFWDGSAAHPAPPNVTLTALNDQGVIVGVHSASDPTLDQIYAVLVEGGQAFNLNALVDAPFWNLRFAGGINGRGEIAVAAELPTGALHALRLVPHR